MDIRETISNLELSPFAKPYPRKNPSILKTKDAKKVHEKLRRKLSENFVFSPTRNILDSIDIPASKEEIKRRQEAFNTAKEYADNVFLKKLKAPKPTWRPPYAIIVVTEEEDMYGRLKKMNVPVSLLVSEHDIEELKDYEIVQQIECEKFGRYLEQLDNVIFFDNPGDIYLERYLHQLSAWHHNIEVLDGHMDVSPLKELLHLLESNKIQFSKEDAEKELENINQAISDKLKSRQFAGSDVFQMLDSGSLPDEIKGIVANEIKDSEFPNEIFMEGLPVKLDYEELDKQIKMQESSIHIAFAEKLKKHKDKLHKVPGLIRELEIEILFRDFCSIFNTTGGQFPDFGQLQLDNCRNLLLKNPEPVSFYLDKENRCSVLTGANSGGKTTLIEHIIQIIILGQLGLPVDGNVTIPQVKEIFYFAKNKGSMNQGAFETLLNQMASIKSAENAIVLADEMEAITEPGVAADIISASAEFFIDKGFYLVFATHLGRELQNSLPEKTRIDGIEATGLDEKFNLIINRSPVLGKLAHSTPELIIERLAQKTNDEYFRHLEKKIRR
ncbi:MAG: hypothetical protein ACOCQX_01845 [Candidatus Nanoarchaeia archaeon]